MGFQLGPVGSQQASGIPGEYYDDSESVAAPFNLASVSAAYNIIGATAYTVAADLVSAAAGNAISGGKPFLGYLVGPKEQANFSSPIGSTMTLPNGVSAAIVSRGNIWVTLPDVAAIGDIVIYDNTTGALSTIAPGVALPTGKSPGYATVYRMPVTVAGPAVIAVNVTPAIPVLASPNFRKGKATSDLLGGNINPEGNPSETEGDTK